MKNLLLLFVLMFAFPVHAQSKPEYPLTAQVVSVETDAISRVVVVVDGQTYIMESGLRSTKMESGYTYPAQFASKSIIPHYGVKKKGMEFLVGNHSEFLMTISK